MENKQLITQIKEFAKLLDHSKIKDNFYLTESYSQSLLEIATLSSTQYNNSWGMSHKKLVYEIDDIINEMFEPLYAKLTNHFSKQMIKNSESVIKDYLDFLNQGCEISSETQGDYYGNSTQY